MAQPKEYPKLKQCGRGFEVFINEKDKLPGIYINGFAAQKAIEKYNGEVAEAKNKRKNKNKKSK
jgi:hypothetical protein